MGELTKARTERNTALATAAMLRGEVERKDVALRVAEAALTVACDVINRDSTGLAMALVEVVQRIKGGWWITEGRGPYEWDDDRYRDETATAFNEVQSIALKGLAESGKIADEHYRPVAEALATVRQALGVESPLCTACPRVGCKGCKGERADGPHEAKMPFTSTPKDPT